DSSRAGFAEAIEAAKQADIVIISVGEARDMTGEAKSRSNISLPGVQEELIRAVQAVGKPVVVLISAGRPLVFNWTADHVDAILYTWWLGTEAGNSISDVLFGDYNPSAKLPITFPRTVGQVPIYYNHYNTGRPPRSETNTNYVSAYIDLLNSPKFPFGYGLSYTSFSYSPVQLSADSIRGNAKLTASVTLTNTGKLAGTETVQLYIRDVTGSVVRPVKELKGFKKLTLQPGESAIVDFTIVTDMLKFYNKDLKYDWEPGEFIIMIGGNSNDVKSARVKWMK
ncbi:MAG TPA: glycoside hydrolase family 3 C-terminal domain-containing protein, partial [Chitinophagaceae bacterium]|nr:glycoside hydrolase family 3 C-terminal domain-containing protein [Chitinophagaceae bacterium]